MKSLVRLIDKEKTQITNIKNEREDITRSTNIKRLIRKYHKQLCNKFNNLDKIGKFLEEQYSPWPTIVDGESSSVDLPEEL